MTTTISFATRDCLVIGCDSLATTTMEMMNPYRLVGEFFNFDDLSLKVDDDGNPRLQSFQDIAELIEQVPYNQLPSVTKIFDLKPAKIGLLFAGAAVIGSKSIKNIVDEFRGDPDVEKYLKDSSYTVSGTAKRLYEHIQTYYNPEYKDSPVKPVVEIMVSGYSREHAEPEVQIVQFGDVTNGVTQSVKRGQYSVIFGGQHDVIQRVVNGLDTRNYVRFMQRVDDITNQYREFILQEVENQGGSLDIPTAQELEEEKKLDLYSSQWVQGTTADLANFSEQAAIDLVDFLVDVMRRAQQFSNRIPTVGGDIHVALITKSGGFRWISKEEYNHKGHGVPKHD